MFGNRRAAHLLLATSGWCLSARRRLDRHIVGRRADPQCAVIILEGFHRAPELRGRVRLPRGGSMPRAIGTGEPVFTCSPCPRLTYWPEVAIHARAKSRPRV